MTELAVDIIVKIAKTLNSEIERTGEIRPNNKLIWDNILHRMDNHVWRAVLETLQQLDQQHPELFEFHHSAAIERALQTLNRHEAYYDSVLDMRNKHLDHKKIAWKCLMTIREVYCNSRGIDLPNSDASKISSTYGEIFESAK